MLYIVPTPIGNLEDMTFRAVRLLKEADFVLAEDTRTTSVLFKHFDIHTKCYAYHKFNEHKVLPVIIDRLRAGGNVALVSDAGTPGISDPGFLIVRECLKNEIKVQCLPGATALIPALVNSGLPIDRFCFEGFLPVKKGRATKLASLANEPRTMVFYESPHRLLRTLNDLSTTFSPQRMASISREISKIHEETITGTLSEILLHFEGVQPKGEFVIIVAGSDYGSKRKAEASEKENE